MTGALAEEILSVFIGCSDEGVELASIVQCELDKICYSYLERQGRIRVMSSNLQRITEGVNDADYGIVVFSKKDMESKNGDLLFMSGLLRGTLGAERFSMIVPRYMDIGSLTQYLQGCNPYTFDSGNPNKCGALGVACSEISDRLKKMTKRKLPRYYVQLENKKRMLIVALESLSGDKDKYNPLMACMKDCFDANTEILSESKILGTEMFILSENKQELVKIGGSGIIKSHHKLYLYDDSKIVVQCYKKNELLLGENVDRFLDDEELYYEYVFCCPIRRKAVLAVHIGSKNNITSNEDNKLLTELEKRNGSYIGIIKLVIKGGLR
ncbi:MAG: hypothetical protein H6Q74_76 [Firmicutes bacterium]|nr:hypothetical protein [Bacillota bacterium]